VSSFSVPSLSEETALRVSHEFEDVDAMTPESQGGAGLDKGSHLVRFVDPLVVVEGEEAFHGFRDVLPADSGVNGIAYQRMEFLSAEILEQATDVGLR
jgi:hypothetical protein